MSKRTVVLLFVALVVGIVFTRQPVANAIIRQGKTSANVAAPFSVTYPLNTNTSDSNGFPRIPDTMILDLLGNGIQQTYWIQPTRYLKQIPGFARTGYGVNFVKNYGCEFAQQGWQSILTTPESLSQGNNSLAPYNLILRL